MLLIANSIYFAALARQDRWAQVERIEERQTIYEEQAQQMQSSLARQQRLITSATDNYRADAYDSGVERIAEQQLIAAEYQMLLLQVIAQQNAQTIELMVMAGP